MMGFKEQLEKLKENRLLILLVLLVLGVMIYLPNTSVGLSYRSENYVSDSAY